MLLPPKTNCLAVIAQHCPEAPPGGFFRLIGGWLLVSKLFAEQLLFLPNPDFGKRPQPHDTDASGEGIDQPEHRFFEIKQRVGEHRSHGYAKTHDHDKLAGDLRAVLPWVVQTPDRAADGDGPGDQAAAGHRQGH